MTFKEAQETLDNAYRIIRDVRTNFDYYEDDLDILFVIESELGYFVDNMEE